MTNADSIKSDTLTILLCHQQHKHMSNKSRAIKIAKCCKIVRDRTKDETLYNACRNLINATSTGKYDRVIGTLNKLECNYSTEYLL